MTDLSQTPSAELQRMETEDRLLLQSIERADIGLHAASKLRTKLAAINAELQRRQKDETQ